MCKCSTWMWSSCGASSPAGAWRGWEHQPGLDQLHLGGDAGRRGRDVDLPVDGQRADEVVDHLGQGLPSASRRSWTRRGSMSSLGQNAHVVGHGQDRDYEDALVDNFLDYVADGHGSVPSARHRRFPKGPAPVSDQEPLPIDDRYFPPLTWIPKMPTPTIHTAKSSCGAVGRGLTS